MGIASCGKSHASEKQTARKEDEEAHYGKIIIMEKKERITTKEKTKAPAKAKVSAKAPAKAKEKYIEAIGRRKTAIARVRVYTSETKKGSYNIEINGISFEKYFPSAKHRIMVCSPFASIESSYATTVLAKGGGVGAQAEAVRLGIARALIETLPEFRAKFKSLGYLRRDPRMVERKKFGSRKARRPQQWRKR